MSDSPRHDCPFCAMPAERVIAINDLAFVVRDAFPVSKGHTLVVPRRHVGDFFELTADELAAMFVLLHGARADLDRQFAVDGYNLGVNIGEVAGQTVMHAHLHLVPRYSGDVPDPVGGIRNIIPGRGRY